MSDVKTTLGVVVGVDGSPSSVTAAQWAAREASMRKVPLTLVHVVVTATWGPATWLLPSAPIPLPAESDPELERSARTILSEAANAAEGVTHEDDGLEIRTELFFAVPVPTLVDLSKEAQMVVVGSRGRHPLQRTLLGSVSTGLIHHAHCPVAVIHDAPYLAPERAKQPVVVGVDGSPASELATAIAFDEASWRGVDLIALHACRDADLPSVESSAQQAIPSETLSERLVGWRQQYPDVTVHPRIVWNSPAYHLLEESEAAQLVVVGSHGRGGFAGMLLGSVSTAIAHAARVPVIVARQR